ncbi:MAG TPA: 30S ribosomal protein S12 methylthiotransferase RimO [Chloroflexota bacterium]|nr:30S ribosomal protein S12 methylthiotransferase RimO [Chloroflexota bacterium]
MALRRRTFFIENLGCPKNAVEGEGMADKLVRAGYAAVAEASKADVVVVNTCSFIRPAQEESIDRIFHHLGERRSGQKVIAAGCLAERYGDALRTDVPELDGILSTRRWHEIDQLVSEVERGARPCWQGAGDEPSAVGEGLDPTFTRDAEGRATAYVKIAEGCNMTCTFCAIPGFKGAQRSKPPEDIVREVTELVATGIQEVILVSQNTTAYGQDFAKEPSLSGTSLARLLERICDRVPGLPWLRFHYCYPGWVNDDLLQTMARLPQVVKYLDIPLQHAHPQILKAMRRPSDVQHVKDVLARARALMPDLAIRTTFIAGFPGETAAHFQAVLDLMTEVRFDHVGVFPYHPEDGTPAAALGRQVSERVKQSRKSRALELQQEISLARHQTLVGKDVDVLVEGEADGSLSHAGAPLGTAQLVGRTHRDAPEVDGFVLFHGTARKGQIVRVRITGAGPYDLFGVQDLMKSRPDPAARVGLRQLPVLQPR